MAISVRASFIIPEPPEHIDRDLWRFLYENFRLLQRAAIVPFVLRETITVDNSVVETELLNVLFPANQLTAFTAFQINLSGRYSTAVAAHTFTLRVYIDAVLVHTLTRTSGGVIATNAGWRLTISDTMRVAGVAGQYADHVELVTDDDTATASDAALHTINTTLAHNFRVTVQLSNAAAGTLVAVTQGNLINLDGVPS